MEISEPVLLNWLEERGIESVSTVQLPSESYQPVAGVPLDWLPLLSGQITLDEFVQSTWLNQAGLENTAKVICQKLQTVALITLRHQTAHHLLYVFTMSDAMNVFIAGRPTTVFPHAIPSAIHDALASVYAIHDGFIDLFDEMTGLQPLDKVRTLLPAASDVPGNFVSVFEIGSNMLGFEVSDDTACPYIIWGADDDVEEVDNFALELDEWLAAQLEEFDDSV